MTGAGAGAAGGGRAGASGGNGGAAGPPSQSPRPFIVAIDGPAGAGKSTVSRAVAARLGFALVDTGAIYRSVALAAVRAGVALDDDAALAELLRDLDVRFEPPPPGDRAAGQRVFIADEDVTQEIRTPAISLGASTVSARPVVRSALLGLQRRLATGPGHRGAVLEGRDIGTVVFPDADLKFFLTASVECRARRRFDELRAKGEPVTLGEVLADQEQRDRRDSERDLAPLRPADDAVRIDSSRMPLEQVVERLATEIEARLSAGGRSG
jgi:cytidylate kinase